MLSIHTSQVGVEYNSGPKEYSITPSREDAVVQIARKSYPSMAKSLVTTFSDEMVTALAKKVNIEIDHVCSSKTETILKKHCDEVAFSWEKVWSELELQLPTLLSLLVAISKTSALNKPLICMIIVMILKQRYHYMAFVQGIISVILYGNCAHKQVRKLE